MKTTMIEQVSCAADNPPVPGARRVFWYINGEGWVHKGWLMPEVKACGYYERNHD